MGDGGDGNGEDGNGGDGGDGDGMADGGDGGDLSREMLRHSGGRRSANRKASCPPAKFGGVTDRGFTFPHLHHFASARRSRPPPLLPLPLPPPPDSLSLEKRFRASVRFSLT